jgi:hypothetical protein
MHKKGLAIELVLVLCGSVTGTFLCPVQAQENSYTATVHHEVLDENADTYPADDTCPRDPQGTVPYGNGTTIDKGSGSKYPLTKKFGAPVYTDVVVKP